MGKLQEHRIEKREVNKTMRKPLIQYLADDDLRPSELETETIEMSGTSSSSEAKSFSSSNAINNKQPEFRILREPKDGNVVEKLVGQFKIPNIVGRVDNIKNRSFDSISYPYHPYQTDEFHQFFFFSFPPFFFISIRSKIWLSMSERIE